MIPVNYITRTKAVRSTKKFVLRLGKLGKDDSYVTSVLVRRPPSLFLLSFSTEILQSNSEKIDIIGHVCFVHPVDIFVGGGEKIA